LEPRVSDRLESWKEIAGYFGVNVRTAQHWERTLGLPIQRLPGPKGRVYALRTELEAWHASRTEKTVTPVEEPPPSTGKRWPWAVGLAAAILALAGWGWASGWLRSKPPLAQVRLEGQILVALDSQGKEAWRYDLGGPALDASLLASAHLARPWVGDLDGDGSVEVLFPHSRPEGDPETSRLICLDRNGSVRWIKLAGRTVRTRAESFAAPFFLGALHVLNTREGKRILWAAVHHLYYPTQVALLNVRGEIEREYWHSGNIHISTVGDLNGDGVDEAYMAGVANGYRKAVLVVLDPRRMGGASREENPDYQLLDMEPPYEEARLLLPRTALTEGLTKYGAVEMIRLERSSIILGVREAPDWGNQSPEVLFHFNARVEVEKVALNDNYYGELKAHGVRAGMPEEVLLAPLRNVRYITAPADVWTKDAVSRASSGAAPKP
jgi:hypothetical protein